MVSGNCKYISSIDKQINNLTNKQNENVTSHPSLLAEEIMMKILILIIMIIIMIMKKKQ